MYLYTVLHNYVLLFILGHQLLSLCYSILQRGRSDSDNTLQK